jgi:hypothetical protein
MGANAMIKVLGIDPGADSPGYAVWNAWEERHTYVGAECPSTEMFDVVVVESGWVGKMGRQAMWGLGFNAGWRIYQASSLIDLAYTIRPDGPNGWRSALPVRLSYHAKLDGLPKAVIVARLRVRYGVTAPAGATDDMIEAMGIAEAAAAILARPLAKQRRALRKVEFR